MRVILVVIGILTVNRPAGADWEYVARVAEVLTVPLMVNGDITTIEDAETAIACSGASGVMIGRGAMGRPWFPGQVAEHLNGKAVSEDPEGKGAFEIVKTHYLSMISLYGEEMGVRCSRKHLAAYIEKSGADEKTVRHWRGAVCRSATFEATLEMLEQFYALEAQSEAA